MKIIHVTKKYPPALGGDAIVVSNLRKQQRSAGHQVVIVTSNCNAIRGDAHIYKVGLKDTPRGLDAITVRRVISLIMLCFRMFTILRRERPDVVHTHSVDMAFFVSFAARFYHVPIVHTFHIVTFYDGNQSLLRRKSELWLARKARLHSATAPNKYDVQKLRAAGLGRTVQLPNGVNIDWWKTYGYTEKNKQFTFIAIGRLEKQKGYEYLIKAAAELAATAPVAFNVIIVGEGSREDALRRLVRGLQVEDIVTLAGRKTPKEIRTLLAETDAAVFPSLYETTPITLLEAWAASVPAIVTSVGIIRDIPAGFDAAYVVQPQDTHSLVQAMRRCIADEPSRRIVAAKGHNEAKKYEWPVVAKSAESIYRSMV